MNGHLEGVPQPYLRDLLTMVINHLPCHRKILQIVIIKSPGKLPIYHGYFHLLQPSHGMILQVSTLCWETVAGWRLAGWFVFEALKVAGKCLGVLGVGSFFLGADFFETFTIFSRWWFQIFFIFTPIWGRFPFWLIFSKWAETTNQLQSFRLWWK